MTHKTRIATVSLAGCFGCHMSFLDIDEKLIELAQLVEFNRSPFTDIKQLDNCDIGLIEGGVCNAENVDVLREFRRRCTTIVAVGACAITGGVPAMRNHFSLKACLEESYLHVTGVEDPQIPNDPELPLLLNQVHPIHEVVGVDYFIPGCPPSAKTIWQFLSGLLNGKPMAFGYQDIHYD